MHRFECCGRCHCSHFVRWLFAVLMLVMRKTYWSADTSRWFCCDQSGGKQKTHFIVYLQFIDRISISQSTNLPFVWIFCIDFVNHGLETARDVSQIAAFRQVFIGECFNGGQSKMGHFIDLFSLWQIWWRTQNTNWMRTTKWRRKKKEHPCRMHLQYEAKARCDAAPWLSASALLLLLLSSSVSSSSSSSSPKNSSTFIMLFDCSFGKNNIRQIRATNLMNFLNRINLISSLPSVNKSNLNLNLSNSQCSSRGALCTIGRGGGP